MVVVEQQVVVVVVVVAVAKVLCLRGRWWRSTMRNSGGHQMRLMVDMKRLTRSGLSMARVRAREGGGGMVGPPHMDNQPPTKPPHMDNLPPSITDHPHLTQVPLALK